MPQNASRLPGRHFLQIPGPTPVPDRILRAIDMPLIDQRGPEFAKLGKRVLEGIKTIFKTVNPVIIFTATGTGAWEAALVNTLSPGDQVLMVETGQFATLWKVMADRLGLQPRIHRHRLARRRRPEDHRGASAQGQGARDQGGLRAAQRDRHRLPVADRGDPQIDRRCRPSGAASGRYHLFARLDRLPPRRMGRRRHHRRRAEGPDAAARHVVQRGERQGAARVEDGEAAEIVLLLGRHADHEQARLLSLHAGDADAATASIRRSRCCTKKASTTSSRAITGWPRRRAARCAPGASRSFAASRNTTRRRSPPCCCRTATMPISSATLALETFNISYGASFGPYAKKYFRIGHLGDINDATLIGRAWRRPRWRWRSPACRTRRAACRRRWITSCRRRASGASGGGIAAARRLAIMHHDSGTAAT